MFCQHNIHINTMVYQHKDTYQRMVCQQGAHLDTCCVNIKSWFFQSIQLKICCVTDIWKLCLRFLSFGTSPWDFFPSDNNSEVSGIWHWQLCLDFWHLETLPEISGIWKLFLRFLAFGISPWDFWQLETLLCKITLPDKFGNWKLSLRFLAF